MDTCSSCSCSGVQAQVGILILKKQMDAQKAQASVALQLLDAARLGVNNAGQDPAASMTGVGQSVDILA